VRIVATFGCSGGWGRGTDSRGSSHRSLPPPQTYDESFTLETRRRYQAWHCMPPSPPSTRWWPRLEGMPPRLATPGRIVHDPIFDRYVVNSVPTYIHIHAWILSCGVCRRLRFAFVRGILPSFSSFSSIAMIFVVLACHGVSIECCSLAGRRLRRRYIHSTTTSTD